MILSIILGVVGYAFAHVAGVGYGKHEHTGERKGPAHAASVIAAIAIAASLYLASNSN